MMRLTTPFFPIFLRLGPHVFERFVDFGITGRKLAQGTVAILEIVLPHPRTTPSRRKTEVQTG